MNNTQIKTDNEGKKYLTQIELQKILTDSKANNFRDYVLFYLSFKHGLRSVEATWLKYSLIDWEKNLIWVRRAKNGISLYHPLTSEADKLLKKMKKTAKSDLIFPITTIAIRKICQKYNFNHHQLRHTCGIEMVRRGNDVLKIKNYLGHKNIQNTMVYVNDAGMDFRGLNW